MNELDARRLTVCCADVGSVEKGRFGWALRDLQAPMHEVPNEASIAEFTDAVAERVDSGRSVALGFECPLFVPIRREPIALLRARQGEGNRAWSAGAGAGSLVTGLVEAVWVLTELKDRISVLPRLTLSWEEFSNTPGCLFLWEAFVSKKAKVGSHHGDAGAAVEAFCRALPDPAAVNAIEEPQVFSLIGAAALRSGWDVAPSILSESCFVISG